MIHNATSHNDQLTITSVDLSTKIPTIYSIQVYRNENLAIGNNVHIVAKESHISCNKNIVGSLESLTDMY